MYQGSSIIIKNGKTSIKNYNSTLDTMYQIASCSKFITSLLVGKFYEKGKIDYDEDINNYLRKWKCPIKNITLRHLLTHTSGSTDKNGYLGMEPQIPYTQNLDLSVDIITGKDYSKPFNITEKQGEKFIYSGSGYQVIQLILEEISKKKLYQLLEQYIFKPLKLKNSTGKLLYIGKHKYKLATTDNLYRMYPETAAAGIWMSCNDLSILSLDLLNGLKNDTSKILKKTTIQKIFEKSFCILKNKWYRGLEPEITFEEYKGEKLETIGHGGSNYSYEMFLQIIPEINYVRIVLTHYNPLYFTSWVRDIKKYLNINPSKIS